MSLAAAGKVVSASYDLLVSGGTVLNPATGVNEILDVGVVGDRIAAIATAIPRADAKHVIDATGCLVTPGLIDLHVHSYEGVNPFGCDLDAHCLASGVTTAVDAGSAGPVNFAGFRRLVHERSRTRMLAWVALAQHGVLKEPGELLDLGFADRDGAARVIRGNRDIAVGIKIRLHRQAVGDRGREALELAIQAAEAASVPIMLHVGDTLVPMGEIAELLRPGDLMTHCYTPLKPSIVDDHGRLLPEVREARARGVLFDVGHASRHFDFNLVRQAIDDGLAPDTISTDLHGLMPQPGFGIVVDLPTTMTKFLPLGLSLDQIVSNCTINAARAIGWQDRLGSLEVGRGADVAILKVVDEPIRLRDSVGNEVTHDQRIVATWTIRAGEPFQGNRQDS